MIIAIDGPAGSGKSTTARAVARKLGLFYLDTGAMYRAAALRFIQLGLEASEADALTAMETLDLELAPGADGLHVFLAGEDVSNRIRESDVTAMSSMVSGLPSVRGRLVEVQRKLAQEEVANGRGVVLEGRDIGTVVFPDADLKVFLTADLTVRAQRRSLQTGSDPTALRKKMAVRDDRDSTRKASPLRMAPDAVEIDTTELSFQEQVARIVSLAGERRGGTPVQG